MPQHTLATLFVATALIVSVAGPATAQTHAQTHAQVQTHA